MSRAKLPDLVFWLEVCVGMGTDIRGLTKMKKDSRLAGAGFDINIPGVPEPASQVGSGYEREAKHVFLIRVCLNVI